MQYPKYKQVILDHLYREVRYIYYKFRSRETRLRIYFTHHRYL